jgi:hypothetical protein
MMSDAGAACCKMAKIEWEGIRKSNATAILVQVDLLVKRAGAANQPG